MSDIFCWLSAEKRLRWYGHVCRMPDTRLPKKVMYGQVKGRGTVGRPRKIWNYVLLSDTQESEH